MPRELELLSEEFIHLELLLDGNIPKDIWEKATVMLKADGERKFRMDMIWHYLSGVKSADNTSRFPRLSKVAKLVLTIPHSNAQEERVFSMIRKKQDGFPVQSQSQRNSIKHTNYQVSSK